MPKPPQAHIGHNWLFALMMDYAPSPPLLSCRRYSKHTLFCPKHRALPMPPSLMGTAPTLAMEYDHVSTNGISRIIAPRPLLD